MLFKAQTRGLVFLFETILMLLKAVREVNKVNAVFFDEKDFILG
jgi:hypothetical protein